MPELPDVEVFRRYFDATSLHKDVREVQVNVPRVLAGITASGLREKLVGDQFRSSQRVGKYLFGALKNSWMVFHFGMTGRLYSYRAPAKQPDHTAVLIQFDHGDTLAYIDIRKFGKIALTPSIESFVRNTDLGPDVLSISEEAFTDRLRGMRGSAKSTLMNQSILAGIGNIYSDEILFQAGIHPETRIDTLDRETIHRLFVTLREVLETAIEAGAEVDALPGTFLIPQRKKGGTCPHCGHPLHTRTFGGRTSYFCPERQRRESR
jgi:Formamidopyrimidine-DNA glycosylase